MIGSLRKAIAALRAVKISRPQLGGVVISSAAASALIITSALGHSAAQTAALAALSEKGAATQSGVAVGSSSRSSSGGPVLPASGSPPSAPPPTQPAGSAPAASSGPTGPASSTGGGSSGGGGSGNGKNKKGGGNKTKPPKHQVGHVFVIALSTPSFDDVWGSNSSAAYLNKTLKPKGAFLGGYETLGSSELPDYLAMVSGQAPNKDTESECSTYTEFPATASPNKSGQVPGNGCVYPDTIITVADQVTAAGGSWRGYMDDLEPPSTCVHPDSGAQDNTQLPGAGPQYDTRHNPFIYFGSLLDLGGCATNDITLNQLPKDLKSAKTSPTYAFLSPGLCDDGSATSCPANAPSGVAGEDAFLKQWVPVIEKSAAYKKNGVIMIVFALSGGTPGGASAPTGALILSRWAVHKSIPTTFNPYSVLLSTEDLLGLTPALGDAKGAKSFLTEALPGT